MAETIRLHDYSADGNRTQRTILCVDDEPSILTTRGALLERAGYRVLAAFCGAEAIKLFLQEAIDAVVLDYPMPEIKGAIVDGPLAFDNAISKEAAITKGIDSEVAGDPDILLAPDLEAGNILAKQLSFLANADSAGLVLGARVPVILTSRADSVRSRIAICAVAVLVAHARRAMQLEPA